VQPFTRGLAPLKPSCLARQANKELEGFISKKPNTPLLGPERTGLTTANVFHHSFEFGEAGGPR